MATFTPNFPPSTFLRAKSGQDGEGPRRQTKEEYRKMKELEEGRKAGKENSKRICLRKSHQFYFRHRSCHDRHRNWQRYQSAHPSLHS